jgi:hypothetical protein
MLKSGRSLSLGGGGLGGGALTERVAGNKTSGRMISDTAGDVGVDIDLCIECRGS